MKKPNHFSAKSDKICKDCGSKLKLNLVQRKTTANRCYSCYKIAEAKKGHMIKVVPYAEFKKFA